MECGWQIKYRPDKLFDNTGWNVILKPENEKIIKGFLQSNYIPHLLLIGSPGIGKTTLAKAIANQFQLELLIVPGRKATVDFVRNEVSNFVNTKSLRVNRGKMVLFDEGDQATYAVQDEFKLLFEKFSGDVIFVITSNKRTFSSATYSRCVCLDFMTTESDKKYMVQSFFKRLQWILKEEGIEDYDSKSVLRYVYNNFPDFRHILKTLQIVAFSNYKVIDGTTKYMIPENFDKNISSEIDILNTLKNTILSADIKQQLNFIVERSFENILNYIKENVFELFDEKDIISVFGVINKYDYQSKFVDNLDVNGVMFFNDLKPFMRK